jgi:hypothetical protein
MRRLAIRGGQDYFEAANSRSGRAFAGRAIIAGGSGADGTAAARFTLQTGLLYF